MSPVVFMTKEAVNEANKFAIEMPARIERGMQLVLLEAAKIILTGVQSRAPDVVGGVKDYASKLEVMLLSGVPSEQAVAIVYKNKTRKLNIELEGRTTALLFVPNEKSPKWVSVLGRYQPWPSYMVPTMPSKKDAKVIARQITQVESQDLRDRIMVNKRRIESDLFEAGLRDAQIKTDTKPSDAVSVVDDISYAVLRAEYGFGGPAVPHWRPAMRDLKTGYEPLGYKFIQYLQTGNEGIFDTAEYKESAGTSLSSYDKRIQDKVTGES
jgi:hypothetical protein